MPDNPASETAPAGEAAAQVDPPPANDVQPASDSPRSARSTRTSESSSTSASTIANIAPEADANAPERPRRPRIWELPFCTRGVSYLHVTNTICYLCMFFLNVVANSDTVMPSPRKADKGRGPVITPAGYVYYIRDLMMFLWGGAIAAQSLVDSKGWKDVLVSTIGHSWQILWYGDCIWLILYGTGTPAGVCLAPLFSFAALLAALATQSRVAWTMGEIHSDLQAEGYDGAPPLAYLLFAYPTSMASGWLLILHCHAVSIAVSTLTGGDNGPDDQPATIVGCIVLSLATAVAVAVLLRYRDVVFGLSYTWGMVGVWVAGFGTFEGYLPHQLVAFFCALIMSLLTYCVAAGPRLSYTLAGLYA